LFINNIVFCEQYKAQKGLFTHKRIMTTDTHKQFLPYNELFHLSADRVPLHPLYFCQLVSQVLDKRVNARMGFCLDGGVVAGFIARIPCQEDSVCQLVHFHSVTGLGV
jgi:hypothetical protein